MSVGEVLSQVRVKEYNYFDGMPVLTMKPDAMEGVLDYKSINVGDCHTATIESVSEIKKIVTLTLNDFVKGTLTIEHMADHPLKVIPPKFTEVGKQIKVRVFNIEKRSITFTKKDTFMKDKTPVYTSVSELSQGSKLVGVVVGQAEHGFVVKSFGGLKGLLTHTDVKNNKDLLKGELK